MGKVYISYPQEEFYIPKLDGTPVIAVSAGHGGHKPGAVANGLQEKDLTLDFAFRIGHNLRYYSKGKLDTFYPRTNDDYVNNIVRIRQARNNNCAMFLDIHINAAGNTSTDGIEAFISPEGSYKTASKNMAGNLLASIAGYFNRIRGVKFDTQSQYKSLYVLRNFQTKGIGVLLEIGFITSTNDIAILKDKKKREAISVAIAKEICQYFKEKGDI